MALPSPHALARWSSRALDADLASPADLVVAVASEDARLAGAYERRPAGVGGAGGADDGGPSVVRGTGGPSLRVGPGLVHLVLRLASPSALVDDADPARLVNRMVRPLLRALAFERTGAIYGGRDHVLAARRPVAWVGFAHDGGTDRCAFEAVVGVTAPAWLAPSLALGGRDATSLRALGDARSPEAVAARVAAGYLGAFPSLRDARGDVDAEPAPAPPAPPDAPPWAVRCDLPFGLVGLARRADGGLDLGGEITGSRDALARLARAIDAGDAAAAHAVALDRATHVVGLRAEDVDALLDAARALR